MNRIAICNEMFENLSFAQQCKTVSEIGYGGIEIAPFTIAKDVRECNLTRRHEMKQIAESHGINIIALHWLLVSPPGMHIGHPDQRIYNQTLDYFKELISFGHDLGVQVLVFGSPAQRSIESSWDKKSTMDRIINFFREVGDVSQESGISIAFEPLGPQITNVGGRLEDAIDLVGKINHPAVKLHFDFSAMTRDPLPIPSQIELVDMADIAHVHVNDPNQLGPGMGDLDIEPIIHQFQKNGYGGWYSVETFAKGVSPLRIASESLANLKKYL